MPQFQTYPMAATPTGSELLTALQNGQTVQMSVQQMLTLAPTGGGGGGTYTLPAATSSSLGGVKSGAGLTAASDGTLSITLVPLGVIGQGGATTGQALLWSGTAWAPTSLPASVSPGSATARFPQDADLSPLYDSSGNDYVTTPAALASYVIGKLQAAGARFAKAVSVAPVTLAYASSITIDPTASNQIRIGTLTGNVTLANPTTLVSGNDGIQFEVTLKQDSTGGRTVTLGSMFVLATGDAIPTTASCVVRLGCTWDNGAGVIRAAVSKVWAA